MAVDKTFTELKRAISAAGTFEPTVAYGMPAFRYKTKIVCCYMQCKHHVGLYPYSGKIIKLFSKEFASFKKSTGSVQFPNGTKVPKGIVVKIIRARMKEIDAQLALKNKAKK
jgi:uncharacterized protein YdhG (YjbR/CyaY superfamily)